MTKKGGLILTTIIIISIVIVIGLIIWQAVDIINKLGTDWSEQEGTGLNESESNATLSEGETNATGNETNGSINQTGLNETESSENESLTGTIPNPTGSIIGIEHGDDEIGEYFCNNTGNDTVNPEHGIKVYTYRITDGIKNLSENYIESEKISNVCDDYGNESAINYYIEWKWNAVEGINGYRIYQHYYLDVNFSRNYSHYIDIKTEKLIDTGLDLWKFET